MARDRTAERNRRDSVGPEPVDRPRFGNGQRPAGAPNRQWLRWGERAVASGTITSVSGDHVTAKATTFVRPTKKNAKPTTTTKNVKVTVSERDDRDPDGRGDAR